jgi:ribonuclease Z
MGRWKEGLTFDGVAPMPWLKSSANWFPKTEQVQPDEIRVTFMGSSPMPRPGQMGTSVYLELGNGDSFIFDMGPGSIANYLAAGVPLNRLNDIFLTHLHGTMSTRWRTRTCSARGRDAGMRLSV